MSDVLRKLVSKKKRRWTESGFDLDLTYITDRIVAMGFPSEKVEGIYRNNMADVVRFFDSRHGDHYKVYNLCSERTYDTQKFHGRAAHFPFDDHNAPPMELMEPFCRDVHAWLTADPRNVVAVHCKAGKGRTGVMICAYLIYSRMWETASAALEFYGAARTFNKKGVTIPSQARYVRHFETLLRTGVKYAPETRFLSSVTLHTVPRFTADGGCNPVLIVKMRGVKLFQSKSAAVMHTPKQDDAPASITIMLDPPLPVCGDIKMELVHRQALTQEKMCHLWFNTFFLESNVLTLEKHEVDKAHKDKKDKVFSRDFRVELRFVDVLSKKQAPDSSVYAEAHDQREATGTTVANNAGTQTAALDESPTTSTAPPLADRMAAISSSGRAMGFVLPPDFNSMLTERVAAAAKATAAFEARRNGSAGEMAAESANSTENNAASSNANATASTAAHAPASSNADDIDMRPLTVTVAEEMDIVSESEDDTESEDEDDDDDGDDKEEEEGDDGFRSAK